MRPTMRRATVLLLCAGLAGTAGCGGPSPNDAAARPLEKVTVLTGFNITGQDSFLYVAVAKGYFRAAGLDVTIQPGKGTAANLAILHSGQAQFAVIDMTGAVIENGRGIGDFRVFAAIYQRSVSCIMALQGSGISTPRDLEGKRVGYSVGGVNPTLFPTYAKLAGVDAGKVSWQQMQPLSLRTALIAGSQVDAITEIVIARPAVQAAAGKAVIALPYSDYLADLYGNVMATSLATAMGNPPIVRRFRDAIIRGLTYAIDHPDEAGRILAQHQPAYIPESAAAEVRQTEPYVRTADGIGHLDEARVMKSITLLQGAGAIPAAGMQPADVVTLDLIPTRTPGS